MTKLWWAQIKSVVRLEMKKTFFARRGLWIYALALLPLLLFMAQAVSSSHQRSRTRNIAHESRRPLTTQELRAVHTDMTTGEVIALLGEPPERDK